MKKIIMENGREIEIDDTPYYIKNDTLYVYMPTGCGYGYFPIGKVKEEVEI